MGFCVLCCVGSDVDSHVVLDIKNSAIINKWQTIPVSVLK